MPFPGRGGPADWLLVGIGNPGRQYEDTPHNIGFQIARRLSTRWELPASRSRFRGLLSEGRTEPGGPCVAVLLPQTYVNEAGLSAGPAAGALRVPPERVIVLHDEIDLPFGEIRVRRGGGLAGHNGLKSLRRGLGTPDFWRVRTGVGRPASTDPERVAAYVLGRFTQPRADVDALVQSAAEAAERLLRERSAPT